MKMSQVSPFGNPRINAQLSAPRGLSQIHTSFIGSYYLGILCVPLIILTYFLTANSKKLLELIFIFLFVLLYSFQCSEVM